MKRKKLIIDIVMFILLIVTMGYQHTGNFIHEFIGTALFILFVLHNLVNSNWYARMLKGKYNRQRIVYTIVNLGLLISFLGVMISGLMMSQYLFSFLNLKTTMFARKMHMLTAIWCFIFVSIHLGVHWSLISAKIKNFVSKKQTLKTILVIFYTICILLGCYVFYQKQVWNEMFLLVDFVFLDYQESIFLFIIRQILLMSPFIFLGSLLIKRRKKRGEIVNGKNKNS